MGRQFASKISNLSLTLTTTAQNAVHRTNAVRITFDDDDLITIFPLIRPLFVSKPQKLPAQNSWENDFLHFEFTPNILKTIDSQGFAVIFHE